MNDTKEKYLLIKKLASDLKEKKETYQKLAGELYFLQNGGNLNDFKVWWSKNSHLPLWSADLDRDNDLNVDVIDNVDSLIKTYHLPSPTSVVVASVSGNDTKVFNWLTQRQERGPVERGANGNIQQIKNDLNGVIDSASETNERAQQSENGPKENIQKGLNQLNLLVQQVGKRQHGGSKVLKGGKAKAFSFSGAYENFQWIETDLNGVLDSASETNENAQGTENDHKGNVIDVPNQTCKVVKGGKARVCCAVKDCVSNSLNHDRFHKFPLLFTKGVLQAQHLDRFKSWLQKCGDTNLLKIKCSSVQNKSICSKHFKDKQYYDCVTKKRLHNNAIPCENLPYELSDEDMKTFSVSEGFNKANKSSGDFHVTGNADGNVTCSEDISVDYLFKNILTHEKIKDYNYKLFVDDMNNFKHYVCPDCHESVWTRRRLKGSCFHLKNCHKFTEANNMDPGDVPPQLQGLTFVEEQLIARVHPIICLYKIKGHQYGYSGNVINFCQNVEEFAKVLPHNISELSSIIAVRTQSTKSPETHQDFFVRVQKVRDALIWLKENNDYYKNIEISEENLSLLPEDSSVCDLIPSVVVNESDDGKSNSSNNQCSQEKAAFVSKNFESSSVDESTEDFQQENCSDKLLIGVMNEEDMENGASPTITETCVPRFLNKNQNEQVKGALNWPTISPEPINEYNTEGYICQAFPCLFPKGKASFRQKRAVQVTPLDYFVHLLRYKDQRFAQHPRFRFFAMNSLMRWNALQKGNVFVHKNSEFVDMSAEELKEEIANNPHVLDKIMYQCSNMRGSKQFWKLRSKELIQMIEQLGMPTLFFTLSAADLHWPSLFKMLAPDEDQETMTDTRRRELISENPLNVDHFFATRVKSFCEKYLKPKFKVEDHWYRFEYQHRGSPHVHGILWLDGAPDVTDLDKKSPEELQGIIDYFDALICAEHPNLNALPAIVHPSRIELEEVIDLEKDLAELLNRVQRHTKCVQGYCLKPPHPSQPHKSSKCQCRFKFPKQMRDKSEIKADERDVPVFEPRRNDERLNKYNPSIILIWRANMDIAPVLSKRALIQYLAKYVAKCETKSDNLVKILSEVLENSTKSAKSLIQKLYINACSDRDYCAQEVAHIIMSTPYTSATRSWTSVYLHEENNWTAVSKKLRKARSVLEKYLERPEEHENKSLWFMAKWYNFKTNKYYQQEQIVMVYPNLIFQAGKTNEKYFRIQVLLHVPWRNMKNFAELNMSWEEIYNQNIDVIHNGNRVLALGSFEMEIESNESIDGDYETFPEKMIDAAMAISAMTHKQTAPKVPVGHRTIDQIYDWSAAYETYTQYGTIEELQCFIVTKKKGALLSGAIPPYPDVQFSDEQQNVLNLIDRQIENCVGGKNTSSCYVPKSIIVQGSAGTGKSLIIRAMTHKVMTKVGMDAILLLAPTGVAALNINGSTIQSKLHFVKLNEFVDLEGAMARKFCNSMKNVKFIVFDEYSMIGCGTLGMIDRRLRQATGNLHDDFGGLFVYFFGDIYQLPAVFDHKLYNKSTPSHPIAKQGQFVWQRISSAVILNNVHRQDNESFKGVLNRICKGEVTKADHELLETRFRTNLPYEERVKFDNAVYLSGYNAQVKKVNDEKLEKLMFSSNSNPVPVAEISAKHNCSDAEMGSVDAASGLEKSLLLGPSCKVMLRSNLWTEMGLVNGSVGTLVDIVYHPNEKPPDTPPAVLICRFDNYKGPYLGNDRNLKLVPIPAISKSWTALNGCKCTRVQFPVQTAYAITIHRCQGLTLQTVHIDVGDTKEVAPGATFVAISRAKSLDGIMIEKFTWERFKKINDSTVLTAKKLFVEELAKKQINNI